MKKEGPIKGAKGENQIKGVGAGYQAAQSKAAVEVGTSGSSV